MPQNYFPPLPQQKAFGIDGFDPDAMKRWIEGLQLSFRKAITIQGDLVSSNWDGAEPLDLSSVDTVATAGFAFDSSAGSAQFEGDLFLGGTLELQGGTFRTALSGQRIEITDNDRIRFYTGDADEIQYGYIYADVDASNDPVLRITSPALTGPTSHTMTFGNDDIIVSGVGTVLFDIQQGSTGAQLSVGAVDIYDLIGGSNLEGLSVPNVATIYNSSNANLVGVSILDGSASHPGLRFLDDPDNGMYRRTTNSISLSAGGTEIVRINNSSTPQLQFGSTSSSVTDVYWGLGSNDYISRHDGAGVKNWYFYSDGSEVFRINASFIRSTGNLEGVPSTTGTAANATWIVVSGSIYQVRRNTSARKYKSRITHNVDYLADVELQPAKFYRKDDKRWMFGLIADDLAEQQPLLGLYGGDDEVENFDDRGVLAVLAAKVNRLERQVAELEAA